MATRAKELSDLGNSGHLNVHDDGTVTLEGGNVGIGTNNPTNLLHVKSTVNNGGVITIESTATDSYPFLRLKNDAREYQITAHGPLSDIFTIYDGTAGSHRLVISSSGNVGIGTTGPGFRLHAYHATTNVVGKIESGDDEVWLALTDVGTDSYGTLIGRKSSTNTLFKVADENVNERFTILEGGNVGIGTTSPQQILHIHNSSGNFSAEAVLTGRLSTGTPKAEVAFKRGTSGDGAMLVLRSSNSSGALIDAVTIKDGTGNVGIGTTNPERPLHVRGANAFVRIESTSASQNSQLDIKSTTATWSIGQNQVLANTGTLEFYNGSSSPVAIKTNGNVGIGTSDPTDKLTVTGGHINLPTVNSYIKGNGHNILQVDATRTYFYGGTNGMQFRTSDNSAELVNILDNGLLGLYRATSDPTPTAAGQMYFNTTSGVVKVYDGSAWDQIQALTPFSTINSRYQPHTQFGTLGAGSTKISTYGATAWSEFNSSNSTQFGGHDGHNGSPTDYPAYIAVYLGGRHAVNRLNLVLHSNSFGNFELQGSNNSGTGGSYSTGSWTSLPFVTSNVSTNAQHAGGQYSGYGDGTVLTYQYNNDIAYSSYRLWIKDSSQAGESLGTRYTGWATYYWELYRD